MDFVLNVTLLTHVFNIASICLDTSITYNLYTFLQSVNDIISSYRVSSSLSPRKHDVSHDMYSTFTDVK